MKGVGMVLGCYVVTCLLRNRCRSLRYRLPTRELKASSFLSYEERLDVLWSGDLSLSSLSEPLVLGSEDSRIAGVTPALGWGVDGGVRSGSSSGLSSLSAPAYSSTSLCGLPFSVTINTNSCASEQVSTNTVAHLFHC